MFFFLATFFFATFFFATIGSLRYLYRALMRPQLVDFVATGSEPNFWMRLLP